MGREVNLGNYKKIYDNWQKYPKTFWKEQSENIVWEKNPVKILNDDNKPFYKWYPDGSLNTCFNAIDRHVLNGRGCLLYTSPSPRDCLLSRMPSSA